MTRPRLASAAPCGSRGTLHLCGPRPLRALCGFPVTTGAVRPLDPVSFGTCKKFLGGLGEQARGRGPLPTAVHSWPLGATDGIPAAPARRAERGEQVKLSVSSCSGEGPEPGKGGVQVAGPGQEACGGSCPVNRGTPVDIPHLCSLEGLRDACMAQPRPRREVPRKHWERGGGRRVPLSSLSLVTGSSWPRTILTVRVQTSVRAADLQPVRGGPPGVRGSHTLLPGRGLWGPCSRHPEPAGL